MNLKGGNSERGWFPIQFYPISLAAGKCEKIQELKTNGVKLHISPQNFLLRRYNFFPIFT